ncbi:MAG TPA: glycosyltransferase [Terriglobales bacterium]|nr:glycosyltransferase [Terriglobales bacterium]
MPLIAIFVLLIWIYLTFFHAYFWRMNRLHLPGAESRSPARVAVIIPARNEADAIGRAVSALLRQQFAGELRLFVVDDNSSDGSANVARAAAGVLGGAQRLEVIAGAELPRGWLGKVWAMHQGWLAARGTSPDYILLTDADIEHAPDSVARLVAQAERQNLDLASIMVKLRSETIAEKFLIPAFVYFFFLLYPPAKISNPRSRVAGAAGGCILLRPAMLEKLAGFESIRGEIIDDCALAARVKRAGGRLWLGASQQTRSIRGYRTFSAIRDMIARTAFNQLQHSWLLLIGCILGMLLTFGAPLVLVFSASRAAGWIALGASVLMFATYLPVLRLYRVNVLAAVTLPFAAVFYIYATLASAFRYRQGRGGEWKGRTQDASP